MIYGEIELSDESIDRDYVQYPLRVTREFREKLKASAQKNNRSLMSEILNRLEFSYKYDAWAEKHYSGPELLGFNPEGFDGYVDSGNGGPSLDGHMEHSIQAIEHHLDTNDLALTGLSERVERIERLLKAMPSWQDTEE